MTITPFIYGRAGDILQTSFLNKSVSAIESIFLYTAFVKYTDDVDLLFWITRYVFSFRQVIFK